MKVSTTNSVCEAINIPVALLTMLDGKCYHVMTDLIAGFDSTQELIKSTNGYLRVQHSELGFTMSPKIFNTIVDILDQNNFLHAKKINGCVYVNLNWPKLSEIAKLSMEEGLKENRIKYKPSKNAPIFFKNPRTVTFDYGKNNVGNYEYND